MTAGWNAFEAAHPDLATSICERIGDALWNHQRGTRDGLTIRDVHQHDACNHTISGAIEFDLDGELVYREFIFRSGNMGGDDMIEWGEDVGMYEPPEPDPMVFGPGPGADYRLIAQVYPLWRKEKWLQDLESGYNYDRHFAPGGKTESHYRQKAAQRGLVAMPRSAMEAQLKAAQERNAAWQKLTPQQRAEYTAALDEVFGVRGAS